MTTKLTIAILFLLAIVELYGKALGHEATATPGPLAGAEPVPTGPCTFDITKYGAKPGADISEVKPV